MPDGSKLGRLGDRFGHQRVFLITALLAVVPVLAVAQVGPWPAALLLLATTAFIMSMGARWTPSMALVTMAVPSRMRGGFMSLNSAVQALFGACGAGLAGLIVREAEDGRLENFFWAGVASLGFLAGAAFFILDQDPYAAGKTFRVQGVCGTPAAPAS